MTLRFDLLDEAWLDRAAGWMAAHGHHPYVLLEEWELPLFQKRFAAKNALGALDLAPVMAYHAPGVPGFCLPLRSASTFRADVCAPLRPCPHGPNASSRRRKLC